MSRNNVSLFVVVTLLVLLAGLPNSFLGTVLNISEGGLHTLPSVMYGAAGHAFHPVQTSNILAGNDEFPEGLTILANETVVFNNTDVRITGSLSVYGNLTIVNSSLQTIAPPNQNASSNPPPTTALYGSANLTAINSTMTTSITMKDRTTATIQKSSVTASLPDDPSTPTIAVDGNATLRLANSNTTFIYACQALEPCHASATISSSNTSIRASPDAVIDVESSRISGLSSDGLPTLNVYDSTVGAVLWGTPGFTCLWRSTFNEAYAYTAGLLLAANTTDPRPRCSHVAKPGPLPSNLESLYKFDGPFVNVASSSSLTAELRIYWGSVSSLRGGGSWLTYTRGAKVGTVNFYRWSGTEWAALETTGDEISKLDGFRRTTIRDIGIYSVLFEIQPTDVSAVQMAAAWVALVAVTGLLRRRRSVSSRVATPSLRGNMNR